MLGVKENEKVDDALVKIISIVLSALPTFIVIFRLPFSDGDHLLSIFSSLYQNVPKMPGLLYQIRIERS